ncbi:MULTISPECIES: amidohydrolase family protein [unclassified Beijerinckia]|uniref:metal-dependent hydrolase family protein n=1 Tax=unclassified Beijerinckia TaxID=2638183 RepID=UPI000894B4F9|nr:MULTISPECIES: amidohydrolase family protein [unclassified Beijerinckia]MDH7799225.1 imidazolonepropionase-like amidohydrolase [Beijerinckia sp. GAS462]SED91448.1 Imidazolonepropionase [Beijerinckia sp. 28-YEA-48]
MAIAYVNGQVIDGRGNAYQGYVIVDGDKVAEIGRSDLPSFGGDVELRDLTSKSILPGLIDCHVHLRNDGVADPRAQAAADSDAVATLRSARNARRTLDAGITTIRDCGSRGGIDYALRAASQQGLCPTPRLVLSGMMICMTGGHGWSLGYEADGPDGLRRAARAMIKAGADNVKLIASGGILSPGTDIGAPQFTIEEMRAAVEEAHAAGKICCAHAHGATAIKNATKAGVDSIEHGYLIDDEGIQLMLDRGTYLVATSAAVRNVVKHGTAAGIRPDVVRKAQEAIERHVDGFKRAYKAGVKLAMGTDTGVPFTDHGNNLDEIVYLEEMGLTPMEALTAATFDAAKLLKMSDRIGSLEVGKLADYVVVDGDPLADTKILQDRNRILTVAVGGKVLVDRAPTKR